LIDLPEANLIRRLSVVAALVFLVSTLSACGSNPEEVALEANCERILKNLKAINNQPEVFPDSNYSDADSVSLLLGEETRNSAEGKILAKFPFLDEIIVGREKNKQQIDAYYYAGSIFLIKQALIGTDIEFPYSLEEMKVIATKQSGWNADVNPLAKKLFGDGNDLKEQQGCGLIDEKKEISNSDNYTRVAFAQASDLYLDFASFLNVIRNCRVSGWHEGNKCAKKDYVDDSVYIPSDVMSDEERAILEERARDAEREAQNPSGSSETSNAKPLQGCTSLGQVVQTQSYGQLTCKLVLVNRIKAFVWMRS
jgi:hypothetical protein